MARLHRFQLLSFQQLENSPSRSHGIKATQERTRVREIANAIFKTSQQFGKPTLHAQTAVTLFVRFYSRKSLTENSAAVFGAASLFLAGKIVNEPITNQWVSAQFFKNYYDRGNPNMEEKLNDQEYMNVYYATVLEAEASLLCTLGFDLDIPTLDQTFSFVITRQRQFFFCQLNTIGTEISQKREQKERLRTFYQCFKNMFNDIYKRDPTLVLGFTCRQIILASAVFLLRHAEKNKGTMLDVPDSPDLVDGHPWHVSEGLSVSDCDLLIHRFSQVVYPSSSGAASTAAAESTYVSDGVGAAAVVPAESVGQQDVSGALSPAIDVRHADKKEEAEEGELEEGEVV